LYLIGIIILSPLLFWIKVTEFFDKKHAETRSEDETIKEALRIVCQYDRASVSLFHNTGEFLV